MENSNAQLPDDILEAIEMKAEHEAALHFHPTYSHDQNTACRICYRNGAKEYAIKAQGVKLGKEQLQMEFDLYKDEMSETRQVNIKAIKLLNKFISRHEAGLLPDRFIYNEIKTFLDGK